MCMMKKVVIAGLAVAVGVAVLAWISPPLFDWMVQQGKNIKNGAEDAIPLEQRIDVLQGKLKDIKNNKSKYYDQAAKQAVEVDQTTTEVNKMTADLALQWQKIDKMRNDLDTEKVSFVYNKVEWKRGEVEKQLKQDFVSYKTAEAALAAKKDLLTAKKQALDAAPMQLADLEGQNAEMEARLEQMRAELERVRLREAQSGQKRNDNEYANLKAEMDEVGGKDRSARRSWTCGPSSTRARSTRCRTSRPTTTTSRSKSTTTRPPRTASRRSERHGRQRVTGLFDRDGPSPDLSEAPSSERRGEGPGEGPLLLERAAVALCRRDKPAGSPQRMPGM